MPTLGYDALTFLSDNRRLWLLGGELHYARIHPSDWAARIADVRQAGLNTVVVVCPWMVHEPRADRFTFDGGADVASFIRMCGEAGLQVVVRVGPYVGGAYSGGGLPNWFTDDPALRPRESNELGVERVSRYLHELLGQIVDLQASDGGPIVLVQAEHGWTCGNQAEADVYLREILRMIREAGFETPIINANDLWQRFPDTIDTWRGRDDLFSSMRQLREVSPESPILLSVYDVASPLSWGDAPERALTPEGVMRGLGEVIAAGGQAFITPFHGGVNFGVLAGRGPGGPDDFLTPAGAAFAPLGEAGARGRTYRLIKRLATFATHFQHVLGDLDPDFQPVTQDLDAIDEAPGRVVVAPTRGAQGSVVFVFAAKDATDTKTTLLLTDGARMPIHFADQPVAWYPLDVDLHGAGRLDYTNVTPYALVDRSVLVLYGPEKSTALLSIDDAPIETTIPGGQKPVVIEHHNLKVVLCNPKQIDACYVDETSVYVGASGIDAAGRPQPHDDFSRITTITRDGVSTRKPSGDPPTIAIDPDVMQPRDWEICAADGYIDATGPRFATLGGPASLVECGAHSGYGWYRVRIRAKSAGKKTVWLPVNDRASLFLNGEAADVIGRGPGGGPLVTELKLKKGDNDLVLLVEALGRFTSGADDIDRKGLLDHPYVVKPFKVNKPKRVEADPISPFLVKPYIPNIAQGQLTMGDHLEWSFTHARKSPILVDLRGDASGVLLLNDEPFMYIGGRHGAGHVQFRLIPGETEVMKRGRNVLRFAPDPDVVDDPLGDIEAGATFYECAEPLTDDDAWWFARWETPGDDDFQAAPKAARRSKNGAPIWARAAFDTPDGHDAGGLWFDASGLGKGRVIVNGLDLGRYFVTDADGRSVGPRIRSYIPRGVLRDDSPNDLVIFDEYGRSPVKTKIVIAPTGDLDDA